MSPEELFKIEDAEIPESKEENVISSQEENLKNKKIDIFSKDLTIEDLMTFLKQNNISNDLKTIEKYYEEIITNNKEKELIVETIKELDSKKETIVQQLQTEPDNRILLKKINELDEKISDLNTAERAREDNTKIVIKNITNTNVETNKLDKIDEIKANNFAENKLSNTITNNILDNKTSKIIPDNVLDNKSSDTIVNNVLDNKSSDTIVNNVLDNKSSEIIPDNVLDNKSSETIFNTASENKISENNLSAVVENIQSEEIKKESNPLENINPVDDSKTSEAFKMLEENNTLEEIKKNNKMLSEISKNIDSNFELMLKAISENVGKDNSKENSQSREIEPTQVENPKISQPQYISEYRKSLRKYSGIESFMGNEVPFKGDNLGSYI